MSKEPLEYEVPSKQRRTEKGAGLVVFIVGGLFLLVGVLGIFGGLLDAAEKACALAAILIGCFWMWRGHVIQARDRGR